MPASAGDVGRRGAGRTITARPRRRGSRVSRRASPSRLKPKDRNRIAKPGEERAPGRQQQEVAALRPASGRARASAAACRGRGRTATPRPGSRRRAAGSSARGRREARFGRMWRSMMRASRGADGARAEHVLALADRRAPARAGAARRSACRRRRWRSRRSPVCGPSTAMMPMASSITGKANSTSMQPHDDAVEPAAVEGGEQAERAAGERARRRPRRAQAHERGAVAVEDARRARRGRAGRCRASARRSGPCSRRDDALRQRIVGRDEGARAERERDLQRDEERRRRRRSLLRGRAGACQRAAPADRSARVEQVDDEVDEHEGRR